MTGPTLHLTNWSSRRLHGPGRRFTIMAMPRRFEIGDGNIEWLMPERTDILAVRAGTISLEEYRRRWTVKAIAETAGVSHLRPGRLVFWRGMWLGDARILEPVKDGDTFLCACSRAEAAAGRCHRVWAAELLRDAGWRVILDGVEVRP